MHIESRPTSNELLGRMLNRITVSPSVIEFMDQNVTVALSDSSEVVGARLTGDVFMYSDLAEVWDKQVSIPTEPVNPSDAARSIKGIGAVEALPEIQWDSTPPVITPHSGAMITLTVGQAVAVLVALADELRPQGQVAS